MTGTIDYGAKQAIENCTHVKPEEKVVIITDNETLSIGEALKDAAEKITPENVFMFKLENYGERPDDGSNPLKFPEEIATALKDADVGFYSATCKQGELNSLRRPMLDIAVQNKKLRQAHMPGITEELMCTGMSVDYDQVQKVSANVLSIVKDAKQIRVTSPAGTDVTVEFDHSYKWIVCDGIITAEDWSNLPDGEIFTCAKNANGKIVVDGILGDYMSKKFGVIEKTPVVIDVKDGRVVNIDCEDSSILDEMKKYIAQDENANRIGEFAIGTNIGLTKLIGNLLQDEKFPGVHVALGHGYPEKTGSNWNSKAHLDMVLQKVTIEVDGKLIMTDGKFLI